jgi:hypothetical protein
MEVGSTPGASNDLYVDRDSELDARAHAAPDYSAHHEDASRQHAGGNVRAAVPTLRACKLCRAPGHDSRNCPQKPMAESGYAPVDSLQSLPQPGQADYPNPNPHTHCTYTSTASAEPMW